VEDVLVGAGAPVKDAAELHPVVTPMKITQTATSPRAAMESQFIRGRW
jgi:hypothetical protein